MADNELKNVTPVPYAKGEFLHIQSIDKSEGLVTARLFPAEIARLMSSSKFEFDSALLEHQRLFDELHKTLPQLPKALDKMLSTFHAFQKNPTAENRRIGKAALDRYDALDNSIQDNLHRFSKLSHLLDVFLNTQIQVIRLEDLPNGTKAGQIIPAPVYEPLPIWGQSVPPKTEETKKKVAMR